MDQGTTLDRHRVRLNGFCCLGLYRSYSGVFLVFRLRLKCVFSEIGQLWMGGASDYVKDRWNVMDFFMNSLYLATISTKICAYMKHMGLSEGFDLQQSDPDLAVTTFAKRTVVRVLLILRTNIKMKNIEEPNGTHFIRH